MPDPTPSAREQVSAPWRLLSTLPSTNWKMVSGTLVAWATLVFMFVLIAYMAHGATHDSIVLSLVDSLLLYAATVGGVLPAAQYALKRGTFKPGGPDDQRAALDMAATAQDVAAETGQPVLPTPSPVPDAAPVVGWKDGSDEGVL